MTEFEEQQQYAAALAARNDELTRLDAWRDRALKAEALLRQNVTDAVTAKINDEGRSNAAHWRERATAAEIAVSILKETLDLTQSFKDDAQSQADILAQHLRLVLEVARTWRPDYATKMDDDTLANAAAE